ncbi:hypothetical protein HNQ74_000219 [Bartonella doshiae]|uniref:Uncharacterized protein n=2 Tax=Bartonella doshiae TaxID=33044 RepID=A0A380ZHI3_BARDO|nr:hypothetical protein MCS_01154 [Bartonella doshiae NCTC 12862 = ATCC 700133]MBB6158813.1 hypothetical protein [Bartonella doshiae]SUV45772.1 Uncharacterised protein [Bartonella doshiae]
MLFSVFYDLFVPINEGGTFLLYHLLYNIIKEIIMMIVVKTVLIFCDHNL